LQNFHVAKALVTTAGLKRPFALRSMIACSLNWLVGEVLPAVVMMRLSQG
jgi:hypothetical protein